MANNAIRNSNDDFAPVGSEVRLRSTSRNSNSNSPINMDSDFDDDWEVDPFSLSTKEIDVLSAFGGVVEDAVEDLVQQHNSNLNQNSRSLSVPVPLPPRCSSDTTTASTNSNHSHNPPFKRKRSYPHRSRVDETGNSVSGETETETDTETEIETGAGRTMMGGSKNSAASPSPTTISISTSTSNKRKSDSLPILRRKKKPKGMPKRPLSAYNLYFQAERTKIIANQQENNGPRIGFEGLGKIIGKKWRDLGNADKKGYEKLAETDSERYRKEMVAYNEKKAKRYEEEDKRAASRTPVLSSIAESSCTGTNPNHCHTTTLDAGFPKGPHSFQVVAIGDGSRNSALLTHPPRSMVSSVSMLPPGAASVSYQPMPPPLQHHGVLEVLNPHMGCGVGGVGGVGVGVGGPVPGPAPPNYFSRPAAPGTVATEHQPPPPYPIERRNSNNHNHNHNPNCPMPPGMEVVLADHNGIDRKYTVQYTCYSMTRQNANRYIDSLTTGINHNQNHNHNHNPLNSGLISNSTAPSQAPAAGAIGTNPFYGGHNNWG